MRLALIVNPTASSVTRRALVVIQKALASDHEVTVSETTRKGQAIRLAHVAARSGADVVVALGGDGTLNEVANGLLDQNCAIAPLPGGSTNVFARAVGFPNDAIEATGVLLEALATGNTVGASVGLANDRAFLFHCGIGFDAAVVGAVDRRGPLKKYMGHPLFIASAVSTWFDSHRRDHGGFSVATSDGRSVSGARAAVALNTRPYTYLGTRPLDLAPEASLDAPLSLLALTSLAPHLLPVLIRSATRPGGLPDRGSTRHWVGVDAATATSEQVFPYQLDGEAMDPVSELSLVHRADALRLVVPLAHPCSGARY